MGELETGGEQEDKFGANGRVGRSGYKGFGGVTTAFGHAGTSLTPNKTNITLWHGV